jgi:hypothetical protein
MDEVPLWRGNHVSIKQLVEDFARYLYLPRLVGPETLAQSIDSGILALLWANETFAYAETFDDSTGRYSGLRGGVKVTIRPEMSSLLVRSDVARQQMDADAAKIKDDRPPIVDPDRIKEEVEKRKVRDDRGGDGSQPDQIDVIDPGKIVPAAPKRFYGTVTLDHERVGRDAGKIAEEVLAHLCGLVGASVTVTLEIQAEIPGGASEHVVRTVTENCRTLKFSSHSFERD